MTLFTPAFRNTWILLQVALLSAIAPAAAIAQPPYPLTIRASFLHGCLTEDDKPSKPLTEDQVKFCVCMLDLVQSKYDYEKFVTLSESYDKKQPQAKTELDRFFKENLNTCL